MLKDNLITKKDLNLKNEEILQKCWYNGLKEDVFEEVEKYLFAECDYILLTDLKELAENMGDYLCPCNEDVELFYFITCSSIFDFIRSKLWNEGINLLTTIDGGLWCVKIRKDEKYKDNYILPVSAENFINMIIRCSYKKDYSPIKELYNSMIGHNVKSFDEKVLKDIKQKDLNSNSTPKKNKKKSKKKDGKNPVESDSGLTYINGPVYDNNVFEGNIYNPYDTIGGIKLNAIHTCPNVDYDVNFAVNNKDVVE